MKRELGAGEVLRRSVIDPMTGAKLEEPIVIHELKSIGEYTKKECMDFISNLVAEMEIVGIDTPKFREILQGLMLEQNSVRAAV